MCVKWVIFYCLVYASRVTWMSCGDWRRTLTRTSSWPVAMTRCSTCGTPSLMVSSGTRRCLLVPHILVSLHDFLMPYFSLPNIILHYLPYILHYFSILLISPYLFVLLPFPLHPIPSVLYHPLLCFPSLTLFAFRLNIRTSTCTFLILPSLPYPCPALSFLSVFYPSFPSHITFWALPSLTMPSFTYPLVQPYHSLFHILPVTYLWLWLSVTGGLSLHLYSSGWWAGYCHRLFLQVVCHRTVISWRRLHQCRCRWKNRMRWILTW